MKEVKDILIHNPSYMEDEFLFLLSGFTAEKQKWNAL
jgi:hypothetical protein